MVMVVKRGAAAGVVPSHHTLRLVMGTISQAVQARLLHLLVDSTIILEDPAALAGPSRLRVQVQGNTAGAGGAEISGWEAGQRRGKGGASAAFARALQCDGHRGGSEQRGSGANRAAELLALNGPVPSCCRQKSASSPPTLGRIRLERREIPPPCGTQARGRYSPCPRPAGW